MPREFVWATPADVLVVVVIFFALAALVFVIGVLAGAWVARPVEVDPDPVDDPDRAVEVRARRRRPHHTGTVHVPGVRGVPADDLTVVIRHPDGVQR